ncbi:MAG: type IV pilus modification PilV family protein [Thermoleophilia bacterium]
MKMSSRLRRIQAQEGFTLLEVMVAAVLLLIVLIPMLGVLISSVNASITSETQNTAALLAQEQIEEIRARNYASMTLNASQIDAQSGIEGSAPNYTFLYEGTTFPVVSHPSGTITPVSPNVKRRNAVYSIKRYVLWVDDPATVGSGEDYKKIVVVVSWAKPQPGSLTFEADATMSGVDTSRPPVVIATHPYIGDAFASWAEIGTAKAVASDPDGTPQHVQFQYRGNSQSSFTYPVTASSGVPNATGGYEFSLAWNLLPLPADAGTPHQYNLRVVATDDAGLTGQETHPFFLDPDAPQPPAGITVTDAAGVAHTRPDATTWPLKVAWPAVLDYIDSNTNFNMVIGYLVYRDERQLGSNSDSAPESSTLIASLYGSESTIFYDAGTIGASREVRYRVKSLGRARYWREGGLSVVGESLSAWYPVSLPGAGHPFSSFIAHPDAPATFQVFAYATSWSAVGLEWLPQIDTAGDRADLYLVYRTPGWTGSGTSLVATVTDDGSLPVINHRDENLTRASGYQYSILPVKMSEYLPSDRVGMKSNPVTTSLY